METRPEKWDEIIARDIKDPRYRLRSAAQREPCAAEGNYPEEKQRRWNVCQSAIGKIKTVLGSHD